MIEVPVLDAEGKEQEKLSIDEKLLGGCVHKRLLRDVVIMYEANRRQGTAKVKSRGETAYSKRKPYRQKGTGYARAGFRGSPLWRGGGVAHGPRPRDYSYAVPVKARRRATQSALLAKLRGGDVILCSELAVDEPKTKVVATLLKALGVAGSCLIVTAERDVLLWKSARNIPNVEVCAVDDLNAYAILRPKQVVMTKSAMNKILGTSKDAGT